MKRPRLAAERLRELLDYDPNTGVFNWLEKRGRVKAGDIAGTVTEDGIYIRIDGSRYSASQLAHLWMTDEWPHDQMNHRDGDQANSRWANLKPVTHSQKLCNRGKQQNNTVGLKGVTFNKRRGKSIRPRFAWPPNVTSLATSQLQSSPTERTAERLGACTASLLGQIERTSCCIAPASSIPA